MAGLSDISRALVSRIAGVLYPTIAYLHGDMQPGPTGALTTVYLGWPARDRLNADLQSGKVHVSVFPENGFRKLTPRMAATEVLASPPPTLTAAYLSNVVTFGGTGGAGQVAGVLVRYPGALSQQDGYGYRVLASDTPATVAAQYALAIPNATALGAVLTLQAGSMCSARVVADVRTAQEIRRQSGRWMVSVWAPDPATRDIIAELADVALTANQRIVTAGGEVAFVRYAGSHSNDFPETASLWRRDLRFSVEYATTLVATAPTMLFGGVTVNGVDFGVGVSTVLTFVGEDGIGFVDGAGVAFATTANPNRG